MLFDLPVLQAEVEHLTLEAKIGGYEAAEQNHEQIEHTYAALAKLVGAQPSEIAFVENATRATAGAITVGLVFPERCVDDMQTVIRCDIKRATIVSGGVLRKGGVGQRSGRRVAEVPAIGISVTQGGIQPQLSSTPWQARV